MFEFWLPIGLLIASIGLFAIAFAKKRNHITGGTCRLIGVIWAISVITLSIGIGWSSYQREQTLECFASIKAKADLLQRHIKVVDARQRLMHFADPLQEADAAELQKRREVIQENASSISDETEALAQELASARSQLDKINQARMHREFVLFLCVLVFAFVGTLVAVCRDAIERRRVK